MGSIDLFLEDEGQQYGNMEEAATVARTPATCLEVWSGDHRQTPGGLKKSREAKAFWKKLTKRPLAQMQTLLQSGCWMMQTPTPKPSTSESNVARSLADLNMEEVLVVARAMEKVVKVAVVVDVASLPRKGGRRPKVEKLPPLSHQQAHR